MITIQLHQDPDKFRTTIDTGNGPTEVDGGPVVFTTTCGNKYAVNFADSGLEIHTVDEGGIVGPSQQWVSIQPGHIQLLTGQLLEPPAHNQIADIPLTTGVPT